MMGLVVVAVREHDQLSVPARRDDDPERRTLDLSAQVERARLGQRRCG
jgi:hypothetical protein